MIFFVITDFCFYFGDEWDSSPILEYQLLFIGKRYVIKKHIRSVQYFWNNHHQTNYSVASYTFDVYI